MTLTTVPLAQSIDWGSALVQPLVTTVVIGVVAIVLLLAGVWLFDKVTHFSLQEQIAEKQNIAVAILAGSIVIGLATVIAAVAHG